MAQGEMGAKTRELFSKKSLVILLLSAVSSWILSKYLNIEAEILAWAVLMVLEFGALTSFVKTPLHGKAKNIALGIFSAVFVLSLVLGKHIVVGSGYSGLSDVNYISPYSAIDLCAFVAMLPGVFVLLAFPLVCLAQCAQDTPRFQRTKGFLSRFTCCANDGGATSINKRALMLLGIRWVLGLSALIFILWLPYLIIYWPGFIFGDSLGSLAQALRNVNWNNHHPVAYSVFLWACLKVAGVLGFGHTAGVGLSTVIQMAFMALSIGYFARWTVVRGRLKPLWAVAIALAFGLCSYVGAFSVALWKDPIFTCAGVLITLCLADLAWSHGMVASKRKTWVFLLVASSLLFVFLRNNGVFVVLLVVLVVGIALLVARLGKKKQFIKGYAVTLVSTIAVLLIYAVVTGPGYSSLNVEPTESSESLGVPLNQMARVAALGGDMTESDKEYLGSIIPFDEYPSRYYPCCTDNLKWSAGFNNDALKNGMWSHWVSMLVRNPNAYFQAWELQTFGFWTVNTKDQCSYNRNISMGMPRNTLEDYVGQLADYSINPSSLAMSEKATSLFPQDSWSVPLGWLFWIACYVTLLLVLAKKSRWVLGLIPSLGLALTLAIASPICYWPRYGALLQFLIPYYALLFLLILRKEPKEKAPVSYLHDEQQ